MGRWLRGIALALGAAAVTIALSIAVNFLTTDPSPSPAMLLAPERRWYLAAVVFLGMASVGCQWLHSQQESTATQSQGISGSTLTNSTIMQATSGRDTYQVFGPVHFSERPVLSREEIQNRHTLLGKVKAFWIDSFLKHPNSLYSRARLALEMESQPHRIRPHVEVALPDQAPVPLPQGTRLINQVDKLPPGGTLLVLGEPGGGKTTLLLELASDLIDRTDPADPTAQIPVVLNLSSWNSFQANAKSGNPFAQWLVNALVEQYQVGKAQGADWLAQQQLVLLLDGLDEVAKPRRQGCLVAIQQFYQGHGRTPLVVCCRVQDFEALATTPKFHGTVYIRLLKTDQIERYLADAGKPLAGVRAALAANPDLQIQDPDSLHQLVKTPLFLNIISMTYWGKTAAEIAALGQQGQRVALFDTYIERMFQQRPEQGIFTQANTVKWLHILAANMSDETFFEIERIQPRIWLRKKHQKDQYKFFSYFYVISIASFLLKIFSIDAMLIFLIITYISISEFWSRLNDIEIPEGLQLLYSRRFQVFIFKQMVKMGLNGVIFGFALGLTLSLVYKDYNWQDIFVLCFSFFLSAIYGGFFGIVGGLVEDGNLPVLDKIYPNQDVIKSIRVLALIIAICVFMNYAANYFMGASSHEAILSFAKRIPVIFVLFVIGGIAISRHIALRTVLWLNGLAPRDLAAFLDFAAERLLVQQVGGSYVFVHRLLQEHFADPSFAVRHGLRLP